MDIIRSYITGIVWALFLVACSEKDALLELALKEAGSNRVELQKVLDRYRDTDEEKYRAACFLIRNMPFYYSYEGKELDKYLLYFQVCAADRDRDERKITDSLKLADGIFHLSSLTKRKDIETVDSAFLVTHIEWAFKVWREQPWGKNVSFADFCEYILPYRIKDEPLSLWREELYNRYNPLLDSLRHTSGGEDPLQAAQVVLAHLGRETYRATTTIPDGPGVGPRTLEWRVGTCREFTAGLVYACRALGIPCGVDYVILWGDRVGRHFWNFTLDKAGNGYAADSPSGTKKYWRECQDFSPKCKGKVYRTTFSPNENILELWQKGVSVYPTFCYPFFQDVTASYLSHSKRMVEIPEERFSLHKLKKGELIYLCLTKKQDWEPIDYTVYERGAIRFESVEGNVTCIVGSWNGQRLIPLSLPFYISEDPSVLHFYQPAKEKQTVSLTMKFHRLGDDSLHIRMAGGVIEGSDRADFRNADTLYIIPKTPYRLFSIVRLKTRKAYRYMRYKGEDWTHCNIAELSFYATTNDTVPLHGKIIGTPGCRGDDGQHEYTNAFDGDVNTSFDYKEAADGWVGLDFGRPVRVAKAVYTPRNRVNFIYKGYDYELFYWEDGCWNSLGRQTATADSLLYQAPVNALLYLRCYTEGQDEHVFEYRDGRQIFWR